jgi:hypothetical protein
MEESRVHDHSLTSALKAVAEDDVKLGASAAVESRLLEEVRLMAHARRRRTRAAAFALAAALVVAVAVRVWRSETERRSADTAAVRSVSYQVSSSAGDVKTAFLPLRYSDVPVTGAQIVRLEVPRAALTSFGVAPADTVRGSSAGTVLADVLVGADGLARAVRFVSPTTNKERKP